MLPRDNILILQRLRVILVSKRYHLLHWLRRRMAIWRVWLQITYTKRLVCFVWGTENFVAWLHKLSATPWPLPHQRHTSKTTITDGASSSADHSSLMRLLGLCNDKIPPFQSIKSKICWAPWIPFRRGTTVPKRNNRKHQRRWNQQEHKTQMDSQKRQKRENKKRKQKPHMEHKLGQKTKGREI